MRLQQAIMHYNENNKGSKLTQTELGRMLFPNKSASTRSNYISRLASGEKESLITTNLIKEVCRITGVDANFLFDVKQMEE